jgi:hypothetical protein
MRYLYLLGLLVIAGCGAPYKVVVYGDSGKQYLAPDLCGAIVECRQAKEQDCLYNSTVVTSLDGKSTTVESCKTVTAK